MMEKKITEKQMYEAIIDGIETGEFAVSKEDIKGFCHKKIDALERKAAKAKETAAKKRAESDALMDAVEAVLPEDFETIAAITNKVEFEDEEVTVHKVTYRLNKLVEAGKAEKQEITVGDSKRKAMAYKRV